MPKDHILKMAGDHRMTGQYHYSCSVPGYPRTDTTEEREIYYNISVVNDSEFYVKESGGSEYKCRLLSFDSSKYLEFRRLRSTNYVIDVIYYYFHADSIASRSYGTSTFCRYEEILHTE
ncbi:hypothetical protein GCM10023093_20760 [Nemorincola caseinilytica]|uniref:Uncharacterized protein n=1 Tax=Nemorincola caseinilytica TaxID=2054315 RepID=A0ABP8NFJ6_9BACT